MTNDFAIDNAVVLKVVLTVIAVDVSHMEVAYKVTEVQRGA